MQTEKLIEELEKHHTARRTTPHRNKHQCINCFAANGAYRFQFNPNAIPYHPTVEGKQIAVRRNGRAVFTGDVRTVPDRLDIPLKRRTPTVWFVNSMSDLFHEAVPDAFIGAVFAVMQSCPQHTLQVLTKRPERMAAWLNEAGSRNPKRWWMSEAAGRYGLDLHCVPEREWPLPNVWLGTSVEDQPRADERIPHLLRCPAAVRFLSVEPQVGDISWRDEWADGLHWMIFGGESGPNARPYNIEWPRAGIRFARRHEIAPYVKQLGKHPLVPHPEGKDIAWQRDCGFLPDWVPEYARAWVRSFDPKGGDPSEWPADLRVREMPNTGRKAR